ncbi:MAG TPA: hydroxymethylbilane synthase [Steroidobacteraceae bacterium]|jgi:hydroxymethylbilane synthase|nr:hydroxymethylbilane synthase [Steroidobacteraceae bacterium]
MTRPPALRIGTRASALALWQARHVAAAIARQSDAPPVKLVHIATEGDVRTDVPLWTVGGKAFFTKEIDRALLAREIDVAVHSLKDLATALEPGTELAAVIAREDPRDALVSRGGELLQDLPRGARVGSSSLRRRAFLAHARRDLKPLELRGNVPTRIERLQSGAYDAIILATAGLKRLGLQGHISCHLPVKEFPPAVSQGAIGLCVRADDAQARRWVSALDDRAARLTTTAERALLASVEAGCQVPLGALATLEGEELHLHAAVCALDGSSMLTAEGRAPARMASAVRLGERLAHELLAQGAQQLIADVRGVANAVAAP